MPNYDFDYFLSTIKHLDYKDVVHMVEAQLQKSPQTGKRGDGAIFNSKLEGLLYWLETGRRYPAFPAADFLKLRELGENLIAKKQVELTYLASFAQY